MSGLTGKRRYREEKRFMRPSLLVLQVEETTMTAIGPWPLLSCRWRDATVEDLMTINANHRPFQIKGHAYVDQPHV